METPNPLIPNRWRESNTFATILLMLFVVANAIVKGRYIAFADVWLDEAYSIFYAQGTLKYLLHALSVDPNPPLYNVFLKYWTAIFGIEREMARLPSLLFSLGSSALLFKLAKRFFNLETAIFASVFYLVSQVHLDQAQMARSYALSSLLCLSSFYFYFDLFEREKRSSAIALVALSWALILTHYSNFLIFIGQAVCSFLLFKEKRMAFRMYWIGQIAAAILFLPWLWYFLNNGMLQDLGLPFETGRFGDVSRVPGAVVANKTLWWVFVALLIPSLVYFKKGLSKKLSKVENTRVGVLLAWSVVAIVVAWLISPKSNFFEPKYLMFLSFGFWIYLGFLVSMVPIPKGVRAVVVLAFFVIAAWDFHWRPTPIEDWKNPIAVAKREMTPTARVIVTPYYHSLSFAYEYKRSWVELGNYEVLNKEMQQSGVYCISSTDEAREQILQRFRSENVDRIILIQSAYQKFDPEGRFPAMVEEEYQLLEQEIFSKAKVSVFSK